MLPPAWVEKIETVDEDVSKIKIKSMDVSYGYLNTMDIIIYA